MTWLGISSFMKPRAALIAFLALDDHFLDLAMVEVADRALDEVAVAVDQRRRGAAERPLANLVPQAGEIVEVALDLDLGAREARRCGRCSPSSTAGSGRS